ncbi:MAG: hypothetical protein ACYDD1_07075 [Caulobacteraceae bacterium]
MSLILIMVAAASLADPAPTPVPTPTPVVAPSTRVSGVSVTAPLPDGDKVVCKTTAVTGTRFPTKTCATKAQWAARKQDDRDYLDSMLMEGLRRPDPK